MNENYQQKTLKKTIDSWLTESSEILNDNGIASSRLDAEIILSDTIKKDRTYLVAHKDSIIQDDVLISINKKIRRRIKHEPIAYIIGQKDFFKYTFIVNKNTLIPRPESEGFFDAIKYISNIDELKNIVDVGTGTGCLGISISLDHPSCDVTLIDISDSALKVAEKNTTALGAKINILHSDLLESYTKNIDLIVANLPYVDAGWNRSPETEFEPKSALISEDGGLQLIKTLIKQAKYKLNIGGYLILESDPCQFNEIIRYSNQFGYSLFYKKDYIIGLKKLVA